MPDQILSGLIIRAQSGFFTAETGSGVVVCGLRGKLKQGRREGDLVAVGDRVRLTVLPDGSGVIEEVERTGSAVIPGLPVVDTVKRVAASGAVGDTVDRDTLLAVQTPQGFRRDVLDAAYASATGEFTDDAALVAAAGHPVRALDGHAHAFKITTPADLERAKTIVSGKAQLAMRVGIGTDVHAYAEEGSARTLWLAQYGMDDITAEKRARFLEKVERKLREF